MALHIDTFSNIEGGFPFFKAVGHPGAAAPARTLVQSLAARRAVAVYDPLGFAASFAELHDLGALNVAHVFVQDIARLGRTVLGRPVQPVTDLAGAAVDALFVVAFDAGRLVDNIRHLVPAGTAVVSLDEMRLDAALLTNPRRYLDPLNFATNFALFRDGDGDHTRLVTANYWHGYGARDVQLWLTLFAGDGAVLATWSQPLPAGQATVVIDSRDVKTRFALPDFAGQLFIHVVGARGHDIVKYALDTFTDGGGHSCTHDANAWPADWYAGLPAPRVDERVMLWVQNSHPCPIPAGALGLRLMGASAPPVTLADEVPPFGSLALDVASLLPAARWPQQLEVHAGKHFVRPRYEVENGHRRIAHANVERTDLTPDPKIAELSNLLGKGYILPAPVLPPGRFRTTVLPTPMATTQASLPIAAAVYDGEGRELARHAFGNPSRADSMALEIDALVPEVAAAVGHVELLYDFANGGVADGWLHALFRYEDRQTGHVAETSFGAHMFNTVLTYRGEPQSYAGRAPGLTARLFLRLGPAGTDTLCHLIYPASTPWHATSQTRLILHDPDGAVVATERLAIPCGGSRLWRFSAAFTAADRARAMPDGRVGHIVVRDETCRLFGYHGLVAADGGAFSFDHMFGF